VRRRRRVGTNDVRDERALVMTIASSRFFLHRQRLNIFLSILPE